MITYVLPFLQEQGVLILMGWMLLAGILHQVAAARRYRRLRSAIQSLGAREEQKPERKSRRKEKKKIYGQPVHSPSPMASQDVPGEISCEPAHEAAYGPVRTVVGSHDQSTYRESELDAQLQYLKQSLDRIAAGRDQKLEEEVKERPRHKLTPEQEAVIGEILREYLS